MPFYPINFVYYTVFISLAFTALLIFYLGKTSSLSKQGSISTFILALGIALLSFSHLLMVGRPLPNSTIMTLFASSIFTLFGIVVVSYELYKRNRLVTKHNEVKAIISNLKDKYYRQEISEETLRQSHAELLQELARLEVKLGKDETDKT